MSQVEAAVYSLSPWVADYDVNGHTEVRQGNRSERFYPTAPSGAGDDRWVAVACWTTTTGGAWRRDGPRRRHRARLATVDARRAAVDEVEALVENWTATRQAADVAEMLQAAGVECVPVADLVLRRRPPARPPGPLRHPDPSVWGRPATTQRLPQYPGHVPAGYERTSPILGEHNEMVLGEILGLDSAERSRPGRTPRARVSASGHHHRHRDERPTRPPYPAVTPTEPGRLPPPRARVRAPAGRPRLLVRGSGRPRRCASATRASSPRGPLRSRRRSAGAPAHGEEPGPILPART